MFGSDDKNQADNTQQTIDSTGGAVPVVAPPEDSLMTAPPDPVITPTAPPLNDQTVEPQSPAMPTMQPPAGANIVNDKDEAKPNLDAELSDFDASKLQTLNSTITAQAPVAPLANVDDHNDLLSLKQQALQSLSPLVNHLDQTPEEKFKTTMMLIQASDNASLIKDAFDAAKAITDEKARAQALLDVVNEINYFTQHGNNQQ